MYRFVNKKVPNHELVQIWLSYQPLFQLAMKFYQILGELVAKTNLSHIGYNYSKDTVKKKGYTSVSSRFRMMMKTR